MDLFATQPIRGPEVHYLAPDFALFALETLEVGFWRYQLLQIGSHQSR